MNTFELNKIAAAVIVGALVIIGINHFGHSLFEKEPLAKNAYVVEGVEEEAAAPSEEAAEGEEAAPSLAALLAQATPDDGAKVFKKCAACHSAEAADGNRTGPNLYNTVGHPVASHAGFAYSDAMKSHGGQWTFEALDAYLSDPKINIPGNKMSFAGLKKASDRAAVIVYLNAKSDSPLPLPVVEAAPADAAPAAEETPAAEAAPAETPAP